MAKQIEGTWEEVAAHAPELAGRRVRLAILEDTAEPESGEISDSASPKEESKLAQIPGLVHGRMHGKPFKEWKAFLDDLPVFFDEADFEAFERAIAENRAMRRALAQERTDESLCPGYNDHESDLQ